MTKDQLQRNRPHVYNDVVEAHQAGLSPQRIARRAGLSIQTVEAVVADIEVTADE